MSLVQKLRDKLRRRPLTAEEIAARTEAKLLHEQNLEYRTSADRNLGRVYRPGGR